MRAQAAAPFPALPTSSVHDMAYAAIIERCLQKNPKRRFHSMDAVRAALIKAYDDPREFLRRSQKPSLFRGTTQFLLQKPFAAALTVVLASSMIVAVIASHSAEDTRIGRLKNLIESTKELPFTSQRGCELARLQGELADEYARLGHLSLAEQTYEAAFATMFREKPLNSGGRSENWQLLARELIAQGSKLPERSLASKAKREEFQGRILDETLLTHAGLNRTISSSDLSAADNAVAFLRKAAEDDPSERIQVELVLSMYHRASAYAMIAQSASPPSPLSRAVRIADEGVSIAGRAHAPWLCGLGLAIQSDYLRRLQENEKSKKKFEQARQLLLSDSSANEHVPEALEQLCGIAGCRGDTGTVIAAGEKASSVAMQSASLSQKVLAVGNLARIYKLAGQNNKARRAAELACDLTRQCNHFDEYVSGAQEFSRSVYQQVTQR